MLELEHGFRAVDVHLRLEPDADGRGDPEQVERELHQAGVVRALAFPPARERGYLKANNAVARMSVGRPFVALARIGGARDPSGSASSRLRNIAASRADHHASPGDVEQYAYDDRFVGFRLDPVRDGLPDQEVLAALSAVGLPVSAYGGEGFPPSAVEQHLLSHGFPLVVSHFGGHPIDTDMMHRAIDLLDDHDNCYLDTTFVRRRDPLERAVREHPDRVLFGSGAPTAHPNVAIMEILTLDVPEDAMRRVFAKNAARVIKELAP
jgi:predicted TIM-barrel fold metal-dependent hydrolase